MQSTEFCQRHWVTGCDGLGKVTPMIVYCTFWCHLLRCYRRSGLWGVEGRSSNPDSWYHVINIHFIPHNCENKDIYQTCLFFFTLKSISLLIGNSCNFELSWSANALIPLVFFHRNPSASPTCQIMPALRTKTWESDKNTEFERGRRKLNIERNIQRGENSQEEDKSLPHEEQETKTQLWLYWV